MDTETKKSFLRKNICKSICNKKNKKKIIKKIAKLYLILAISIFPPKFQQIIVISDFV